MHPKGIRNAAHAAVDTVRQGLVAQGKGKEYVVADARSLPARVLQTPRVGFGLTTAALVALASGGTGVLVAHGTSQLQPPAPHLLPSQPSSPPTSAPVLVPGSPGSLALPPALIDRTARGIHRALTQGSSREPRRVRLPLVDAPPPETVVVTPPVLPPVLPPVVLPPVAPPPVVTPSLGGKKKPHPAHPDDRGKHLGQEKH
jgi:hypothetical protein